LILLGEDELKLLDYICRNPKVAVEELLEGFCREAGVERARARRMLRALERAGKVRIVVTEGYRYHAEPTECRA